MCDNGRPGRQDFGRTTMAGSCLSPKREASVGLSSIAKRYAATCSVRRFLSILRAKPYDTSDAVGRSRERYRRAARSTVALFGARAVSIATGLITVPLTLEYLGAERYGMWMTISSLIAMVTFADLGIGNGLMNRVSGALGRDDHEAVTRYVSSAFFALAGTAIAAGAVFLAAWRLVPWSSIFNVVSSAARAEAGPAVGALAAVFLVSLPLGVVQRLRLGQQEGFVDSLWTAGGSLLALISVIVAIRVRAGLPMLAIAMAGAPLVATVANGSWLFFKQRPWLRPRWRSASWPAARDIVSLGGHFLVLQLYASASFGSNNVIIAQVLGAESVAQFAIVMKLFGLIPMAVSFVTMPLWPAYAEAFSRGDLDWAWRTLRRSVRVALTLSAVGSGVLLVAARPIIDVWVGREFRPDLLLLAAFGSYVTVNAVAAALSAFCNGAGMLKIQVALGLGSTVANVVISVLLTKAVGVSGVLWGSVIAQALLFLVPIVIHLSRVRSRLPGAGGQEVTVDRVDGM